MTRKHNFLKWDLMGANEMCFVCECSGDREKMCPWIGSEEPVPGWVAIGRDEAPNVQSYKILRCPMFRDAPDDPGMTDVEYREACRGLIVELYRKVLEYRKIASDAEDASIRKGSELRQLRRDYKLLEKRLKEQEELPEGAAS